MMVVSATLVSLCWQKYVEIILIIKRTQKSLLHFYFKVFESDIFVSLLTQILSWLPYLLPVFVDYAGNLPEHLLTVIGPQLT